jgi:hypothetical protein
MPFLRRRAAKKTTTIKKTTKTYEVDGKTYSSKALKDYHVELSGYVESGLIKSFELPEGKLAKSKFHSIKATIDGIEFDSLNESRYYIHVLEEVKAGNIKSFELQKAYEIVPSHIRRGKKIRKMEYLADFVCQMSDGTEKVIDVKGIETDVFKMKKKLVEYLYPNVEVQCVRYVAKERAWLTTKECKAREKAKKASKEKKLAG